MAGIFPFLSGPPQNSTLGRNVTLFGGVSRFNGRLNGVSLQFGVGGPVVDVTNPHGGFSFGYVGLIPNNIRPGQAFQIIVYAWGTMVLTGGPEPEDTTVDGETSWNYVLENVVPSVSVNVFQNPLSTKDATRLVKLTGSVSEANPAVYGVPQVQCRIDNGPLVNAAMSGNSWSAQVPAGAPGDHVITIQAVDRFESVAAIQRPLTVLQYPMPAVVDPNAKKTSTHRIPTSSSITSWTRLEPQVSDADMSVSSSARLFDPLWLMTRQWQVGEFQGEDTGSPVQARVRATTAPLTRCVFGELSPTNNTARPYDPRRAPLETLVERRRMRAADATEPRMLSLAVEAGLHFLRMVELNTLAKKYRPAFLTTYVLQEPGPQPDATAEEPTLAFVRTMAGRAPDARRLASAFRPTVPQIAFDPVLKIKAADLAAVQQVAAAWLAWYDSLFAEPAGGAEEAWVPPRLEYAASVAARLSAQANDAVTLSASEFDGGRLDWCNFDVNTALAIDTSGDARFGPVNEIAVPAPVTFLGAPAPRFWELEDAKVAYGIVPVGPTDLIHLMIAEYASSYGNDWFLVPLTVPVGSISRVDSLVVTDSFGVRSLVRPIGDPALGPSFFSMWQQSRRRDAGRPMGAPVPNCFFLPPTLARSVDGAAIEDVLFMRDEMANVAWGIERNVESAAEVVVPVSNGAAAHAIPSSDTLPPNAPPRYRLSSDVPENWIPLMPVQIRESANGPLLMRLKRGAVLQPDGTNKVHKAKSEALKALGTALLYDEEVPREGVHITRRRRMVRWIDGSTWVWTAFRNDIGSGEGSAGLRFDQLLGPRENG
jgi:hypothetical protein